MNHTVAFREILGELTGTGLDRVYPRVNRKAPHQQLLDIADQPLGEELIRDVQSRPQGVPSRDGDVTCVGW